MLAAPPCPVDPPFVGYTHLAPSAHTPAMEAWIREILADTPNYGEVTVRDFDGVLVSARVEHAAVNSKCVLSVQLYIVDTTTNANNVSQLLSIISVSLGLGFTLGHAFFKNREERKSKEHEIRRKVLRA